MEWTKIYVDERSSGAMTDEASISWQTVAVELLRRRAGGAPLLADERLAAGASMHESALRDRNIDGLYFLACNVDHPRRRLYQAQCDAQVAETRAVIADLNQLGVDPIVFKSLEIGARYDRGRATGLRADVDLLVPLDALWNVRKVMYGRDYVHGIYRHRTRDWSVVDPREALRHEAKAYELWPLRKAIEVVGLDDQVVEEAKRHPGAFCVQDDKVLIFVAFDFHHNILFNFDIATRIARSVPSALGIGRALAPADHLWFSIHRHYSEAAMEEWQWQGPRPLVTVAPIVADASVDWDVVIASAVEQKSTWPTLAWLTFFYKLGATSVPERVLADLRRQVGCGARNWGWQLGRLFDVEEPFPDSLVR
jgi:hypothetical protein